jgi:protein-L-isoaspartate(D-aspartate) O-methyltransferase
MADSLHPVFRSATAARTWLLLGFALAIAARWPAGLLAQAQDAYQNDRWKMVAEQVEREGIRNEAVLNAMRETPRHLFVRPDLQKLVYRDEIVPIGHKQTLSTAYIVGYMTEAIDPRPTDRVLEIGTGSGYQAAVLSKLVKEVYTIEIVEPLGKEAAERLKKLGYNNVTVKVGDGFKGWPEHAPFDKIIVTCSPESVPQPLLDQLREGGKLIIPLGDRFHQTFFFFERKGGKIVKTKLLPTLFVPMTGIADGQRKVHLDPANPRLFNGGFEQATNGVPDSWYYLRQAKLEHKGAKEGTNYLTFTNKEAGRDAHALQGLAIDGARVRNVRISLWVKGHEVTPGDEPYEKAGLAIRFFDSGNRMVGEDFLGPWVGTFPWRKASTEVRVPRDAQMGLIQVGLRGATGRLSVDDVRLVPTTR